MMTSAARRCCCDGPQGRQGTDPHRRLAQVDEITQRGKEVNLADAVLQEAGDSLMMKLGAAANRLSRLGVLAPDGVEWALAVANHSFIIHQYDEINRELTWLTLSRDLPAWRSSMAPHFVEASTRIQHD